MDQDQIVRALLESGERLREQSTEEILAPLTARERSLVRDAAVMAFVLGTRHPQDAPHPKDSVVYRATAYAIARDVDESYPVFRGVCHQYSGIGGN